MLFGDIRRNVKGYAEELERFDVKLGELLDELREDDLLIITADHGNDPTHTGTDHTREKVPFFAYSPSMEGYGKLEDQNTFAVIGATIADNLLGGISRYLEQNKGRIKDYLVRCLILAVRLRH